MDNDRIFWLNEKHIEQELNHKKLREITTKYHSNHRKHRYEVVEEPKWKIDEKLAIKVIMDCITSSVHKFRTRLGFKQYNVILTKEQLASANKNNKSENMQTQYNVLSYWIEFYFHDYKLAVEVDEKWIPQQKYWLWNKKTKSNRNKIGCKCIRIDPDKENFDIFRAINEIFRILDYK